MIHRINVFEITQPVGTFYVGKIASKVLIDITKTVRRDTNNDNGIQRELSTKRARSIAKYCEDPDAAFPTPIILAVDDEDIISFTNVNGFDEIYEFVFEDNKVFAEILDGQHRVEGIKLANNFQTDLTVVIMFNLTEEEKAYIFSTINSTQTKVDKALIYDLFELSQTRSPQKTCHEIARIMNSDASSPFYGRLKMLGKKSGKDAVLSQGTFVNYLCKLISNKPQEDMINLKKGKRLRDSGHLVLRSYFIEERDEIILKLVNNYFTAVSQVFPEEWNDTSRFILAKTTGYGALLKIFPYYYKKGIQAKKLSTEFFAHEFKKVKQGLFAQGISLTSRDIASGEQGQSQLAKLMKSISESNNPDIHLV